MRERRDDLFELELEGGYSVDALIEEFGRLPLPPYIRRDPELLDEQRYQSVYVREDGAVAAPTAGLHFDAAMLEELRAAGIGTGFITLQVGAGTFQPLRSDDIDEHIMHSELVRVSAQVCEQVAETRSRGGRVITECLLRKPDLCLSVSSPPSIALGEVFLSNTPPSNRVSNSL